MQEILTGQTYEGKVNDDRHHPITRAQVWIDPDGKSGTLKTDGKLGTYYLAKGRFISSREAPMVNIENVDHRESDPANVFRFQVRTERPKDIGLWIPADKPIWKHGG
jgi:hypothetical protein